MQVSFVLTGHHILVEVYKGSIGINVVGVGLRFLLWVVVGGRNDERGGKGGKRSVGGGRGVNI